LRMIKEIGDRLSRTELLVSYRRADDYVGDQASQSDQEALRICRRIVMDRIEKLDSGEEELIGGTLKEERDHFEARRIARALERHNGSVPRAARELGLTPEGLRGILRGRHSKTLARRPKTNRYGKK
jgi:transcriptional regulator with GAF, ATPase, and Fis domain